MKQASQKGSVFGFLRKSMRGIQVSTLLYYSTVSLLICLLRSDPPEKIYEFVDFEADPVHNIISVPTTAGHSVPDGTTADRVMSIDLAQTDVYNFFRIISEVTRMRVLACKGISGTIDHYKQTDVPYQQILREVALKQGWVVSIESEFIRVCGPEQ